MSFTVRMPATTANLGPGFDSFGCALGLYNTYEFEPLEKGLYISGCDTRYKNYKNLTVQAYRMTLEEAGLPMKGLRLSIQSEIPVSRGLGSSAAMIMGGVVAANAMAGGIFGQQKLLEIAMRLEPHPDNLAPALYGGLTASMVEEGIPYTVSYALAKSLSFVVCIPCFELPTAKARRALPRLVAHADAVYNISHGAVLLKALEQGHTDLIAKALKDRLHQPYRIPLIPEYDLVRNAALAEGALGLCVSGAGPTLLALTDKKDFAARLEKHLTPQTDKWTILSPNIDRTGAILTGNAG